MSGYLEQENSGHHGFRKSRTLSQILNHREHIIIDPTMNKEFDVIYLHFAKAFDKVNHKILLYN